MSYPPLPPKSPIPERERLKGGGILSLSVDGVGDLVFFSFMGGYRYRKLNIKKDSEPDLS
jgi:hypothetical protein